MKSTTYQPQRLVQRQLTSKKKPPERRQCHEWAILVVTPNRHSFPAILRPVTVGLGTVHGIDNTRDRIFALIRFHTHFLTLQDNSNVTACRSKY